jgi:hypothetical protein
MAEIMKTVVVGGHTRNIGKTAVTAALINSLQTLGWTAVKITQYGHGVCSHDGQPCGCEPEKHPFEITEEKNRGAGTDTSRFLAAGARRALWMRVRQGQLGAAFPQLAAALAGETYAIIESTSVVEFLHPAVFLMVLDSRQQDFKASAFRFIHQADALVMPGPWPADPAWRKNLPSVLAAKPAFPAFPPDYSNADLSRLVKKLLQAKPEAAAAPQKVH